MAGGPLAIAAVVIVLGIIAWVLVSSGVFAKSVQEGEVGAGVDGDDRRDALAYAVPPGQDPAAVLVALTEHGIDGEPETRAGTPHVVVPRPDGVVDEAAWREEVRTAIGTADSSRVDPAPVRVPVRFTDEQGA
jgi:hypothetical protein